MSTASECSAAANFTGMAITEVVLDLNSSSALPPGCYTRLEFRRFQSDLCFETCPWALDGDCDDGGPGAEFVITACPLGSDCTDCGPRAVRDLSLIHI